MSNLLLQFHALLIYSCGHKPISDSSQSNQDLIEVNTTERSTIVNTGKSANEAYEMLHVVFVGKPDIESIKRLMGGVLKKYNLEENYENLNRCGSALLSLQKSSALGISEMDILKHMYQQGDANQNFPNQAAISLTILEQIN